ncbi:MAG: hypothetical protein IJ091_11350 [Oscillospiraceae bacterium]|nr:hypothetical protein [Oscillospiraceae bacterium]MBQ8996395.1 hypothetical protein [Oscillospiraceae bacterium]
MRPTASWYLYNGMSRGLSLCEAYTSKSGEILDLMAADAISHGARQKIHYTYEEIRKMR